MFGFSKLAISFEHPSKPSTNQAYISIRISA